MTTAARVSLVFLSLFSLCFSATPYVSKIEKTAAEKDAVLLVSWNAQNFGRSKTPEIIAFMAKLLRDADMVVLQEVSTSNFGARAVANLSDELNRTGAKWDYTVSGSTHPGDGRECYAYLWKSSKIKIISRVALMSGLALGLEREPAKAEFSINGQTLSIVAVHLVPTAKKPKAEIAFLIRQSEGFLSAPRFILAGDFNLSRKGIGPAFESALNVRHQIDGKTSLKSKLGPEGEHLSGEYDNIFTRGISVVRTGIVDFFPAFGTLARAKKVSDHLPVFIVLRF